MDQKRWLGFVIVLGLENSADRRPVACVEPPRIGTTNGDIVIERDNVTLYVPLMTCLALSLPLSVVLWAVSR